MIQTLGELLPIEQARARELLVAYSEIGSGKFAIMMIEESLRKADLAVISGDLVGMLQAYEELKGLK